MAYGEAEDEGATEIASMQERTVIEANIKKRVHRKASAVKQARLKEIDALEFDGKDG